MPEDDSRLLTEARRGAESSFLSLYQRHRTPLFRYAWRLTGSTATAEDIVQESWMLILQQGNRFRQDRGSVRGYLFGIARNLAFERLRINDRTADEPAADGETDSGPFEELLALERSEAVARAVAALPPLQREALILFEYEELSLEEIAQAAGVDAGAIKARLHRARETLRRRLAPLIATRPAQGR